MVASDLGRRASKAPRRIAVIGGGPAGLCVARLIKLRQPDWEVDLYERNHPEQTYGYGVGLGWSTFRRLGTADPIVAGEIEDGSVTAHKWTVRRGSDVISAANEHGVAISRSRLLGILSHHASASGVRVHTGAAPASEDLTADVVIAADGVASETRRSLAAALGANVSTGDLAYMWCGSDLPHRDEMTLAIAVTDAGPLAAHIMPYGAEGSTFQVDAHCDAVAAWGLAEATDERATLSFLSNCFAELLGEGRISTKRSSWSRFTTVTCDRWGTKSTVLAGDAAHTAHYTVGSGTGLALDDAMVLADALVSSASVSEAFEGYETVRRPAVERIQLRADRSQQWWTTLASRIDLPMAQLMLSYLTRTGALTLATVARTNPELIASCLPDEAFPGDDLAGRVLNRPLHTARVDHPSRVFDDTLADSVPTVVIDETHLGSADVRHHLTRATRLVADGAACVRLAGPGERDAILGRLDVAEQLRAQAPVATIVRGPLTARDDLALGVLSNRTDLVEFAT